MSEQSKRHSEWIKLQAETMGSVKQVWKGRTASLGWTEVSYDSDSGYSIEFYDDKAFEERPEATSLA